MKTNKHRQTNERTNLIECSFFCSFVKSCKTKAKTKIEITLERTCNCAIVLLSGTLRAYLAQLTWGATSKPFEARARARAHRWEEAQHQRERLKHHNSVPFGSHSDSVNDDVAFRLIICHFLWRFVFRGASFIFLLFASRCTRFLAQCVVVSCCVVNGHSHSHSLVTFEFAIPRRQQHNLCAKST